MLRIRVGKNGSLILPDDQEEPKPGDLSRPLLKLPGDDDESEVSLLENDDSGSHAILREELSGVVNASLAAGIRPFVFQLDIHPETPYHNVVEAVALLTMCHGRNIRVAVHTPADDDAAAP